MDIVRYSGKRKTFKVMCIRSVAPEGRVCLARRTTL